eukprot:242786_1
MDEEFTVAIVMDNGRYHTKAGFSGDDAPRAVFPTIVARLRGESGMMIGMGQKTEWVGDEAMAKGRSCGYILLQSRRITKGIIGDGTGGISYGCWDDMEKIWHHTFYNELRIAPEEQPLLLTETALNPNVNREKTTQIMFETFNVPGFYLCPQSVLALYASGRNTGIVIQSGHDHTRAVPVSEGYVVPNAITQLDIGGQQITEYLEKLLIENDAERLNKLPSATKKKTSVLRDIKEKLCLVSIGNNNALADATYELPDGQSIVLKKEERYQCTQPLFEPKLLDIEHEGITHLIRETVSIIANEDDASAACDLTQHVVLSGGNTMLTGLKEKMLNELTGPTNILVNGYLRTHGKGVGDDVNKLVKGYFNYKYNISAPMERKYSTWIGGSILSSLSTFEEMWIKPSEYDETGPTIVHRKCK